MALRKKAKTVEKLSGLTSIKQFTLLEVQANCGPHKNKHFSNISISFLIDGFILWEKLVTDYSCEWNSMDYFIAFVYLPPFPRAGYWEDINGLISPRKERPVSSCFHLAVGFFYQNYLTWFYSRGMRIKYRHLVWSFFHNCDLWLLNQRNWKKKTG